MRTRLALCAVALALTSGCIVHKYRPLALTPEAWAAELPGVVRVTLADGSRVTLDRAELVGDTVRGVQDSAGNKTAMGLATRDVRRLEARRINWPASVGVSTLLAGGVVALGAYYIAIVRVAPCGSCAPAARGP